MYFVNLFCTGFVRSKMFRMQQLHKTLHVESMKTSEVGVRWVFFPVSAGAARGNFAVTTGSILSLVQKIPDKVLALLKTLRDDDAGSRSAP